MNYQIRIRGHLDLCWQDWLAGLEIVHEPSGSMLLCGRLPDQAALFGVLLKINRLGLSLLLKLGPCPLCKGARLNQAALSCKVKGYTIADMAAMEVDELLELVKGITEPAAAPIVRTLTERLHHLDAG